MSTSPIGLTAPTVSNPTNASSSSSGSQASSQAAIDALGNPDTFLQLLVAQLQYQDPSSPADGTTFVTQLATFAGVEEQSAMRSDLDSINGVAQQYSATLTSGASTTPASSGGTTDTSGTGGASGAANTPAAGANGTSN